MNRGAEVEEDIKIVEELQKYCSLRSIDKEENNIEKWAKFVVSIENLIKGYRELEEENHRQRSQLMSAFDRGFIHKSKLKEKIEELDKQRIKMEKDDIGVGFTLGEKWSNLKAKIQVLQELLGDEE